MSNNDEQATVEIRLEVSAVRLSKLKAHLGYKSTTGLVKDAFNLLEWAVHESSRGRMILTADCDGYNIARLAFHSLDELRAKSPRHVIGADP